VSEQSALSDFGGKSASQAELFECEICGRSFDSNKGRGIHRAKSHTEKKIKQVLITELQNLASELNKMPSQRDMNLQGAHSSKTYQKKFGSWNEALKEADLAINNEQSISKSDLIDELVRLSSELRQTPTSRDMAKDGKYAPSSYSNEFGSWNNAVQEAGLEPTRYRDVPRQELICELERLTEELGHIPTAPEMTQHGSFSNKTYSREFGS
jgi:phage terminase small subunit